MSREKFGPAIAINQSPGVPAGSLARSGTYQKWDAPPCHLSTVLERHCHLLFTSRPKTQSFTLKFLKLSLLARPDEIIYTTRNIPTTCLGLHTT
jgi:hypothetical protein